MIYIRDEGCPIKQGFNFYPLSSSHIGFVLGIGRRRWQIRYSKNIRKLFIGSW